MLPVVWNNCVLYGLEVEPDNSFRHDVLSPGIADNAQLRGVQQIMRAARTFHIDTSLLPPSRHRRTLCKPLTIQRCVCANRRLYIRLCLVPPENAHRRYVRLTTQVFPTDAGCRGIPFHMADERVVVAHRFLITSHVASDDWIRRRRMLPRSIRVSQIWL